MKAIKKIITLCLLTLLLTGCVTSKTYYAYTVYPIGYILERIGGNRINITSIQNNTIVQCANVIPEYKEILEDSIYLFSIGNLEPYSEIFNQDIDETGVNEIDLSVSNTSYLFKKYSSKTDNVGSPYYEGGDFDMVDTLTQDLYLWLDPNGMIAMTNDIYKQLASNYVEEAAFFKANYEQLHNDLVELDALYNSLSNRLKSEGKTIKIVTMSPSFGCWQKAYGFQVYPICISKFGGMPTSSQLEIIKQKIIEDGVEYIAYEPNLTEEMSQLFVDLTDELNLKRVNLSNISSLTSSQISEGKDYLTLMKENLAVLENIASK